MLMCMADIYYRPPPPFCIYYSVHLSLLSFTSKPEGIKEQTKCKLNNCIATRGEPISTCKQNELNRVSYSIGREITPL